MSTATTRPPCWPPSPTSPPTCCNSGGAQIGLNLAARHPSRVHTLVAHEPPCAQPLPDAPEIRAAMEDVYQAYRSHGVEAGMQRFQQVIGLADAPLEQPQGEPTPEMPSGWQRIAATWSSSSPTACGPWTGYVPDVAALRPARPGSWSVLCEALGRAAGPPGGGRAS